MTKWMRMLMMLVVVGAAGAVLPGSVDGQEPIPPVEQEGIEVTDELLERFVAVYPAVVSVAQAAQNQMARAETAESAQQIQADAQMRVAELLNEGEITPVEYEAVVVELNEDPELMAKFEEMLEEQEEGSGA